MATPHVAGACALSWSANPTLSYTELKEILLENVDPLPDLSGKCVTGGRLNIYNALLNIDPWVSVGPLSGTIEPNGSTNVDVKFLAGTHSGTRQGSIVIKNRNKPLEEATVPVTLEVTEP
jgi:hypothetical protein